MLVTRFLTSLCPDFPKLRRAIDTEMKDSIGYVSHNSHIRKVRLSDFITNSENKHKIVKGYVQSKKTWAIISIALYYLFRYRKSSFIVVRNNIDDFTQIQGRINGVIDVLIKGIGKKVEQYFQYLDVVRGRHANESTLINAFSGADPRIFVCMRNETDLESINENLLQVKGDFVVIIDEIDDIDNGRESNSQEQLESLKSRSGSVWGVTATPLTNLMKEDIDRGNVHILSRPEWYKDISNFTFHDLPEEAKYLSKVDADFFECDPNLSKYLSDFSSTTPFTCSFWNEKHPRISLIRIGNVVSPQISAAEQISRDFPDLTVITYNGSSYGISLRGKGVEESFQESVKNFSGVHISDVLGFLETRGVDVFSHIVILAGKKADRGISFVSSSFATSEKKLKWHLTEMYLVISKSTSQSNLLQIAGRLSGVFCDTVPLTLISNVGPDILKAYWVQEELIDRAKNIDSPKKSMNLILEEIPISKTKLTKRRITSAGVKCRLRKVYDDNGWDWEVEGKAYQGTLIEFGRGIRPSQQRVPPTREEIEMKYAEVVKTSQGYSLSENELQRLSQKMFPRWASGETSIAKFMRTIDPVLKYTRIELEEKCRECGIRLTDCFMTSGEKRTKYGNIFQMENGVFQLHPPLVKAYQENF